MRTFYGGIFDPANDDDNGTDYTWSDLLSLVREVRNKYPSLVTVDECVAILNEVALTAENGWGLLHKPNGNHGTINDIQCSVDWLVNKNLKLGIDCLISCPSSTEGPEKAPAYPTWADKGIEFDLSKWIAPFRN